MTKLRHRRTTQRLLAIVVCVSVVASVCATDMRAGSLAASAPCRERRDLA